ncbi:bifunctional UDP-N-acetylmuramoyl-tripeptide:D-alanyl-D-alanine ligase/alanine racemase [Myroides albus]|uniref:Alanine racemase n=1 Tax=Myroides albus TaxID=2562892 RepID=A0A6I3LLS3_9FLAO|nr:bifunctional UDP-N-acetylmuramoyl-tripeptide:D-alanyl-D-alanine ligase/alanine racemase [Myroides albus]MTG98456.1 bifunctional UDP-N-acetylmuramoyl-tripeptide:D-alanyl-D-alanine ligase/alanine racemase [Myroides albus]UVD78213.1 bifunctional UDP-N-acetylmuramoyl-tripeptide:D-alanyl-D-alanine ligase/alanine racemase [Myroides albus]
MIFNTDKFCQYIGAEVVGYSTPNTLEINNISVDSRSLLNDEHTLFFALVGKNHNGHDYIAELIDMGVNYFIVSEVPEVYGENVTFFKVENTLAAFQKAASFHRSNFSLPVIGITGSRGKTVVKEWLNFLLSEDYSIIKSPKSYNSQTGVPLSVFGIEEKHNLGVFEVGVSLSGEMSHLEPIVKPTIGILTAITDEHNDGFDSLEDKVREKALLFKDVEVLICEDDPLIRKFVGEDKIFGWSLGNKDALIYGSLDNASLTITYKKEVTFNVEVPLADITSVQNIMTCIATMLYLGYDYDLIAKRIGLLYPVELRLRLTNGVHNCSLIDDAYSADYQSLVIALDFLEKHKINKKKTVILSDVFFSGKNEHEVYLSVIELLQTNNITRVFGIGQQISKYLADCPNTYLYETTDEFLQKVSTDEFQEETVLVKGARAFRFDRIVSFLETKTHETVLEVNLNALRHNLNFYRSKLNAGTKVMVMVKAFGYGSGSFEIAKLLSHENVEYLGVAFADEGIELRKSGVKTKIIVMNPEINAFSAMVAYDLEPEVYSIRELHAFLKVARERNCYQYPVHIKLETGMHRHGFVKSELAELIDILRYTNVVEVKSIFSHLSSSDMPEYKEFTLQQIHTFKENADYLCSSLEIEPIRHILNTSGIYNFAEYQMDMVRLGIGLYGVGNDVQEMSKLQNVSTLKTRIMQVKDIEDTESVGYGRRYRANGRRTIATVPIGYADGISRSWGNGVGYVLVNGSKAMIVGAICMDMLMVDVTNLECKEGDEVVIFGEKLPVTIISDALNTIPYEILTNIAQRVKRIFFQD